LQELWLTIGFTVGVGFTVIVKDEVIPEQLLATGVMVIIAEMGAELLFAAVNASKFPLPFDPKPIPGLLFVQVKVVPVTGPVNGTSGTDTPAQLVRSVTGFTEGVG
jgi:hypothetical protein